MLTNTKKLILSHITKRNNTNSYYQLLIGDIVNSYLIVAY